MCVYVFAFVCLCSFLYFFFCYFCFVFFFDKLLQSLLIRNTNNYFCADLTQTYEANTLGDTKRKPKLIQIKSNRFDNILYIDWMPTLRRRFCVSIITSTAVHSSDRFVLSSCLVCRYLAIQSNSRCNMFWIGKCRRRQQQRIFLPSCTFALKTLLKQENLARQIRASLSVGT